jgi:hypothetical protein
MSSTAAVEPSRDSYVSGAEAIRRYPALSRVHLYRLVAIQRIRVQLDPGTPMRYHAADLARVMSEATQAKVVAAC